MNEAAPERAKLFVSYASGDDRPFVKNLTDTLIRYGMDVWWDEYEITIGDSIRSKINDGLRECGYGVVVLSHQFFARDWPQRELAALATILETGKVLPVFRGITPSEIAIYDPLLADVRGEPSTKGVHALASIISNKIRGPVTLDDQGRSVYRHQQVRLLDIPMNAHVQLENIHFDDCLLQGPVVLVSTRDVEVTGCHITNPAMFWQIPEGTPLIGGVGLVNVSMTGCRFKDVGITVTPQIFRRIMETSIYMPGDPQLPDHLR